MDNIKEITTKFYRGVIEDNNDPKKQGRVKVRILGYHSPFKADIETKDLPWAEFAAPLFGSAEGGYGISSVPKNGTWVWLFFDGAFNRPIYFAQIKSISTDVITDDGFYDPNKKYPPQDKLSESDINRLSRNTIKDYKYNWTDKKINDNLLQISQTSGIYNTNINIQEPNSDSFKVEYPNNNVIETPSGHIIEFDDSEGNERIRIANKNGTYIEFLPNSSTIKTTNDKYSIIEGNLKEYIDSSIERYIKNNIHEIIKGDVNRYIEGTEYNEILTKKYTKTPQETFTGNMVITGDLLVQGSIHSNTGISTSGDVQTSSTGLNSHTHIGNDGNDTSGPSGDSGSTSASSLTP